MIFIGDSPAISTNEISRLMTIAILCVLPFASLTQCAQSNWHCFWLFLFHQPCRNKNEKKTSKLFELVFKFHGYINIGEEKMVFDRWKCLVSNLLQTDGFNFLCVERMNINRFERRTPFFSLLIVGRRTSQYGNSNIFADSVRYHSKFNVIIINSFTVLIVLCGCVVTFTSSYMKIEDSWVNKILLDFIVFSCSSKIGIKTQLFSIVILARRLEHRTFRGQTTRFRIAKVKLLHINATPQCITRNPTNIAWCIMAHRRRCLKHRTPRHFYQKCVWLLHLLLVAHHQTFQFNAEQSIQQRREKKNLVHFPIIFDSIILEMKIEIQCCYSTIATRQIRPENCLNHNTNSHCCLNDAVNGQ